VSSFTLFTPFRDRADAGKKLAARLASYKDKKNVIVLALPRGGVPVAHEIAAGLSAPLDLMLVRKLGAPDNEELAIGAIAMPDIVMLNENIVSSLSVPQEDIDCVIRDEMKEMQRRNHLYRADAPPPQLKDREVIIIDDGMATGADMRAAVAAVAAQKPARITVAVPVAPAEPLARLKGNDVEVVCLHTPPFFIAVAQAYEDFSPVSDEEVIALLKAQRSAA
jgi:putative phosphoribosyl transferase